MEVNQHMTDKARRDYELVKAALGGKERGAYAELMKNYRDSLYFMLLKMTNNPQDAEDLTIEAFGKAFKNLHQYTPDFAFSTWLFRIASNNCIDYMRRQKRRLISLNTVEGDDGKREMADQIPSDGLDPEETFIREQKIETMRQVVEKLKPHYRHLIELRYFKEYSYEEIAEELDLPIGTVKAQLFRAREFLQNIMKRLQEKI
jgi:RNA polymerase sigma-70 factor (ECF subfamily)